MVRKTTPNSKVGNEQRNDISLSRRNWLKIGGAAVGASLLGASDGIGTATAASSSSNSDGSINLAPHVPDRAYQIYQEAPDDARNKWQTVDASSYDNRSDNLTELIESASRKDKIVDLGSGTYEMSTSASDGNMGDLRGIAGDDATVYITTTGTAFPLNGGTLVIEGVTFDITETSDVSLVTSSSTGFEYGLFRHIELRGQRRRIASAVDGNEYGSRHNFMINAQGGGECLVENVSFPDGGVEVDGYDGHVERDEDGNPIKSDPDYGMPAYTIPAATDPPHEGYTVFKDCYIEGFNDNGFYIRNAPGTAVLWNCTAINNARSNMRPGEGDVIVGGRTEVNSNYDKNEQTGVLIGHDGHEFDKIVGLTVVAEGDRWGPRGLQTFKGAEGGTIEKTTFHFKSGNSIPIEIAGSNAPHFDMNNIWVLDERSGSRTFDIGNWSRYGGSLTLGDDIRVDTNATDAFRIGSNSTLTAPNGSTYSGTSLDASDIGVNASLTQDDLPEFYFDFGSEVPSTVIDDFEDGDLSEYSYDDEADVTSAASYRGSYGLDLDGANGTSGTVRSDSGLNAYPGQNDRWEFWFNPQTTSEFYRVFFALQSSDLSQAFNVTVALNSSNQYVQIRERGSNGNNGLGSVSVDLQEDSWYRVIVDGTIGDNWVLTVEDSSGTTLGETTTSNTQYTGYGRSGIAYWISGTDRVSLDEIVITEKGNDPDVVDDFEDGDLSEYSYDDEADVTSAASYRGSYGLDLDGANGTSGTVRSDSGLNAYPGQNDRWEFWFNPQTTSEFYRVFFALQSSDLSQAFNVTVALNNSNQYVQIRERGSNGNNGLGSVSVDLQEDSWYRVIVDGTIGDNWVLTVEDSSGTTLGETTTSNTQYTGYGRSGIAYWISGTDRVSLDEIVITEKGNDPDVVDDFEDGNLSEYSYDDEADVTSAASYRGSYGLDLDGANGTSGTVRSDSGLNAYPGQNDRWEFWFNPRTTSEFYRVFFALQSSDLSQAFNVTVALNNSNQYVQIRERGSNGNNGLGSVSVDLQEDSWYQVIVDGTIGDNWGLTVKDSSGTTLEETTTSNTQYTEYDRSGIAYWISGTDRVSLDEIVITG